MSVDVWAYGCFAFELLLGEPPFYRLYDRDDQSILFNAVINDPIPKIPDKWSDCLNDFVQKCLLKDPQ